MVRIQIRPLPAMSLLCDLLNTHRLWAVCKIFPLIIHVIPYMEEFDFYNNCQISRALIGQELWLMRVYIIYRVKLALWLAVLYYIRVQTDEWRNESRSPFIKKIASAKLYIKRIDSIWPWVCTLIDVHKTSKHDKNNSQNSDPLDCVCLRQAYDTNRVKQTYNSLIRLSCTTRKMS